MEFGGVGDLLLLGAAAQAAKLGYEFSNRAPTVGVGVMDDVRADQPFKM